MASRDDGWCHAPVVDRRPEQNLLLPGRRPVMSMPTWHENPRLHPSPTKGQVDGCGAAAVADLRWLRLSGLPAWLVWLFVHLMYIVEFENRLLVFVQWAWNYYTFNRSAPLITGKNPYPSTSDG